MFFSTFWKITVGGFVNQLIKIFWPNYKRSWKGLLRRVDTFLSWQNVIYSEEKTTLHDEKNLNGGMRFPTMWYVRPAKAQTSLCIRAV